MTFAHGCLYLTVHYQAAQLTKVHLYPWQRVLYGAEDPLAAVDSLGVQINTPWTRVPLSLQELTTNLFLCRVPQLKLNGLSTTSLHFPNPEALTKRVITWATHTGRIFN
jgi:hypothetical protein